MRGIELFVKLRDAGVFTKESQGFSADQMNASFFGGEATVMPAGSWSFAQTPDKMASKIELSGFPVPTDGVYKKPTAFQGFTSSGLWVTRNGAKKEEAVRKFITAFYEPAIIERFVKEVNNVPATLSEGPVESDNPLMTTAVNDLDDTVDYAVLPDVHVPGPAVDPMTRVTALAYDKGDAQSICKSLDKVY
jgi:multiple sugar transport system substrate-binding protein